MDWRWRGAPRSRAWVLVREGNCVGRKQPSEEAAQALSLGVSTALDLTANVGTPHAVRKIDYGNLSMPRSRTPAAMRLSSAVPFIADWRMGARVVYACCESRRDRAFATGVANRVAADLAASVDDAPSHVAGHRHCVSVPIHPLGATEDIGNGQAAIA